MTDVKLSNMIKTILKRKFETGDDFYLFRLHEVPHEHYDGFWPSTNGGWTVNRYTFLSSFDGTGNRFGIKDIDDYIEHLIDECREESDREFIKEHPEYAGKDISYNTLCAQGNGRLAEEQDSRYRQLLDDYTVDMTFTVRIFIPGSQHISSDISDKLHIVIMGWIEIGGKTFDVVDVTLTKQKLFRRKISKYASRLNKLFEAGKE